MSHPAAFAEVAVGHADARRSDHLAERTKLADVAKMMVGYGVHSIVVADLQSERGAWGIVSSLDLARAADRIDTATAGDVASTNLVTVRSNESLARAAALMADNGLTHLIVLQPIPTSPLARISAGAIAAAVAYGT